MADAYARKFWLIKENHLWWRCLMQVSPFKNCWITILIYYLVWRGLLQLPLTQWWLLLLEQLKLSPSSSFLLSLPPLIPESSEQFFLYLLNVQVAEQLITRCIMILMPGKNTCKKKSYYEVGIHRNNIIMKIHP